MRACASVGLTLSTVMGLLYPCTARPQDSLQRVMEIEAAIARGHRTKRTEGAVNSSSWVMAVGKGFDVAISGPLNRVASAAARNSQKYLPFTRDSVDDEMLASSLTIVASPWKPAHMNGKMQVTSPATHIVIIPRGQTADSVRQPLSTEQFDVSWSNALGGSFSSRGIRAYFSPEAIAGSVIEVRIITDEKEYKVGFDRRQLEVVR